MPRRRLAFALLAAGLLLGCAGPLAHAERDYEKAHYPMALRELRALEREARGYGPKEQTRYALYRGLAELALGDARLAHRWLGQARRADLAEPTLGDRDRARLYAAWRSLGLMPGESGDPG